VKPAHPQACLDLCQFELSPELLSSAPAIVTQIVVFPWFGIETGLTEDLTIGLSS